MEYISWFLFSFVFIYIIYYFLFIRKTKRDYKIPSEAQYLIALYKLDTKLFSYQRFVRIVGMVTSFDIALVATMVANIDGSIWQILFGFVIVVPIMVISFMLLGKFYQKKEIKDNSKELEKEKKYLEKREKKDKKKNSKKKKQKSKNEKKKRGE